jgi:DNA-binding GntR family transcriptional regulator
MLMPDEFSIDRRDLTDQVYDVLKTQILSRALRPNEKLSVDRVAKRLGISRTPAKDAINRLAADGLITIERRVGSFVTPVTAKDIREIFSLRLLLELHAAREGIGNITLADIEVMQAILSEMAGYIVDDRYLPEAHARYIDLDHALHRYIIDSPGNDRLSAMYENLDVHLHIARVYYINDIENAARGHGQHQAIVTAYLNQDSHILADVLQEHINEVRDLVLQKLKSIGGIF